MPLDTAKYLVTQRDLTRRFREGVEAARPFYPTLCTVVPSTGADEKYGMLGSMPGVREWLGPRQFKQLRSADFVISNREWENSLEVEKNDVDDDRLGFYRAAFPDFGTEAMHHPDELLFEALVAGETEPCFDGQFFFDTDHAWGDSGAQSNDLTYAAATGTVPTAEEFRAAFHQARTQMLKYKNDQGKKLNRPVSTKMSNLMVVVPPDLELVAYQGLTAAFNASGASNIVIDVPQIVVSPILEDATKFYTFHLSGALKPFVFQARRPLRAPTWKGMDDPETKTLKMMTDARYNLGYLAWWKAVVTTFT
jgi:phage major head subunit gpT-like protein